MTREEINYWRGCLTTQGYDVRELCDQAERAIVLGERSAAVSAAWLSVAGKLLCDVDYAHDLRDAIRDLERVLDSIEPPAPTQAESYDAPTGPGWWWARCGGVWQVVLFEQDEEGLRWCTECGHDEGMSVETYDAWCPLSPPGTTTPDVQAQVDAAVDRVVSALTDELTALHFAPGDVEMICFKIRARSAQEG